MEIFNLAPFVIGFPLAGMTFNLTLGRRLRGVSAGVVGSVAAGLGFLVAVLQFLAVARQPQGAVVLLADWIHADGLDAAWALQIDALSVTMMLVVTGIGTLIHLYAIGYMRGDERFTRFFVYMNLFLAAMLALVTANNFLVMFVGWEGVGLCSFLLIGFWFDKAQGVGWRNSSAARKAFVVNRIGDFGLLLAMLLILFRFGTLDYQEVFAQAQETLVTGAPIAVAITLLLLLGATGKSAQIPLFVWLPDAMAGPTPVSALIHAATMVTAGIYLIARSHVLFDLAPFTQQVVTLVGAATALLAASIAARQLDIKRVLAYSTISQLGFMMAAVGLGAYGAGIFHLIAHAFFKALLFLGAGSVIHGMERGQRHAENPPTFDKQDMRAMGGLRRRMKATYYTYLAGALALAGIPPLAGFFSKDLILTKALVGNPVVYLFLSGAALFTAYYIGRQVLMVFFGEPRTEAAAHAPESPLVMVAPLLALALLSVAGGAVNLPGVETLYHWLEAALAHSDPTPFEPMVAGISTALALLGFGLAYFTYRRKPAEQPGTVVRLLAPLSVALERKWWVDEFYRWLVVRPFTWLGERLAAADERFFRSIDQFVVQLARGAAGRAATLQTGQLNWNVAGIVAGLLIVLLLLWGGGR